MKPGSNSPNQRTVASSARGTSKRASAMTNKVITIEFIVPTTVAIMLGIALSICAVYSIDCYLGPIEQAEAYYSVAGSPSTVTSSSAAFGRWAFGIGQPRRDRRGRTDIVKGRSVRSGGNVLTTLSCSASGISAICCDLTRPTITRLARTFRSTRTRRRREQYMPLVAFCLRHFSADFIICTCECEFR